MALLDIDQAQPKAKWLSSMCATKHSSNG